MVTCGGGGQHSLHPPPLCRGGEPPTKFSKRGGLTEPQLLEGVTGKEEGDFFQWVGCNRHIKNKLKSEIFNDKKKFISKNIFLSHN